MKKTCLLLIFLCCFLLTGCMSSRVEEQLLVIVLGLDTAENGGLTLTVKVPGNSVGGQGGGGQSSGEQGSDQKGYLTLHATGHLFSDTLELLLATTPRSLNFSQVWEIAISRELAETAQFPALLQQLYTLPRMHTQAALVICEGKARKFVEEQKPYVGLRLSRYIEVTLRNYADKGFVPTTTLAKAVREMRYGWQDPLLILGAISQEQEDHITKGNVLDVDAEKLPSTSVNKVKFYGAAATDGEKVSGTLTGYEMALINLIRGGAQSLNLTDENGFPLPLYARTPATLSVKGNEQLSLDVRFICEVNYLSGYAPNGEKIAQQLEREITEVIQKLQKMRCDGLGFGSLCVRRFMTIPEWENFHFREKYASAQVNVNVQVRLKEE